MFAGKGYDSKRRGRSKKSLELLRNGGPDSTPSPNGLDGFGDPGLHFPFHLRGPAPEFIPGRVSPGGSSIAPAHEFYGPEGWQHQAEYMGYAAAGGFPRQGGPGGFCDMPPDPEQIAMMERMGIPPHMARIHNGGFQYRGPPPPPFPQEPGYPHSPIMPPHSAENQFQTISPSTVSPHHAPGGYPSPDPHSGQQPPTPIPREPLMSPAHHPTVSGHQNGGQPVFFASSGGGGGSCSMSGGAPDSPAPGSASSSGSILERALAKQEPASPGGHHMESTPPQAHHHGVHPSHEWPQHVSQGFSDVNVDEYIKHDFGMEGMVEYQGYAAAHHPGAGGPGQPGGPEDQHHQYPHQHTPVSVGPPWVR